MTQKNSNSPLLSALLFVVLFFQSLASQAQDFITKWTFPAGTTEIIFNALTSGGPVNYTWTASPSSTNNGSSSFTMTTAGEVILPVNVPAGNTVTLSIEPANLRQFYIEFGPHRSNLKEVAQWGAVPWSSMYAAFAGCDNLTIPAPDAPDLTNVTDMSYMFQTATSFNQNINHWNTAPVTNMSYMFQNAMVFNQPLDHWNTANVTDMSYMFSRATSFNGLIGTWNTGNVANMRNMFWEASSFNQPIGNWNTAQVTNMMRMFLNATSFNQPIGNWNTAQVTNMEQVFLAAVSFNQPIGNWNTAQVTTMAQMFSFASSFNQPLNNWNTANVMRMNRMFWDATSFNQNIGNWSLDHLITWGSGLEYMFTNSGMDCKNYSATLIGWRANNSSVTGLTLDADGCEYSTNAVVARDALINNQGWTINGDMLDEHCEPTPTCEVPEATTRTIACIEDQGTTRDYHIHWDFPNDGITHPCNYAQNLKIFSPSDPTNSVGSFITLDEELLQNSVWHFEGLFTLNAPYEPLEVCWEIPFCLNSTGEPCNVARVCPKVDNPQHNDDIILDCYDDNAPQVYCDNIDADFSVTCDNVPGNGITHHITLNLSAVIPATANTINCPNFSFYITTITGSFPGNALIRVDMLNVPPVSGFHHLNATVNLDWFDEIGIDMICLQAIVAQYDRCWPNDRNICQKRFCADFKDLDCPDDTDGGDNPGGEGRSGKFFAGDAAKSNLSLAPNPASSGVTFQYDLPAIYQEDTHAIIVTDGVGTLIQRIVLEPIKGEAALDVSTLPNGVYQVSLLNQDKIITTRKMVVVKE